MKCLFLFPPQCRPFQAPLGPSLIKSELLSRGHSCKIIDQNIQFYKHILSKDVLMFIQKRLLNEVKKLDSIPDLDTKSSVLYVRKASALIRIPYIIDHIDEAISIFHSNINFFNLTKFSWGLKILQEALDCYSSHFGYTELGLSEFRMKYSTADPKDIWNATQDKTENPFIDLLWKWTSEVIDDYKPDVIGLSIMMDEQLIPGITLARQIRENWDGKLVIGGSMITRIRENIKQSANIGSLFDEIFFYESEHQFPDWVDQQSNNDKRITEVLKKKYYDMVPNFDDYPLDEYLLPIRVLPFQGSRGCSYGKCLYCSHHKTYNKFKFGSPHKAANILKSLSEKYNTKHFYLFDESLDPAYAKLFSEELKNINADIRFMVFTRSNTDWTKDLVKEISKVGCRRFIIGIDGLTNKVQKLMNKNTDLMHAKKFISWCAEFKIAVQVNVIVGFPGEELEDCMRSLTFFEENKDSLTTLGSSSAYTPFYLVKEAGWDEMAIIPDQENAKDFSLCYGYKVKSGIGMQEANSLTQDLMTRVNDILKSSERSPLLREFAFLYNDFYMGTKEIPQKDDFEIPKVKSNELWTKHDITQLIDLFHEEVLKLKATPNEYLSMAWRVCEDSKLTSSSNGINSHKMFCWSPGNTVEMPIVKNLLIQNEKCV